MATQKFAFFSTRSPVGICISERPLPEFRGSGSGSLNLVSRMLAFISGDHFGEPAGRHYAIIRILYGILWHLLLSSAAGLNPVDCKFLYGDKLPSILLPLFKVFLEGKGIPGVLNCLAGVGFDFVGTVMESTCNSLRPGDCVVGTAPPMTGSFSEFILVPHDFCSRPFTNPQSAEILKQLACVPLAGLTASQILNEFSVGVGDHVLVIGASGGVGHIAVQLAKMRGCRVTAICSRKNHGFVKRLGADHIVDYCSEEWFSKVTTAVSQYGLFQMYSLYLSTLTPGSVIDTVTSGETRDRRMQYPKRLESLVNRPLGKYVCIGGNTVAWVLAHLKRFLGLDIFPANRTLHWVRFPHATDDLSRLADLILKEKLKISIHKEYSLTQRGIEDACRDQLSRRTIGKNVIRIGRG